MKKLILPLLALLSLPALAQTIKQVHCPGPGRDMMVADPAIVPAGNSVIVMGTGDVLKWQSLDAMVGNAFPQRDFLTMFKEVTAGGKKVVLPMTPGELPWDLQIYNLNGVNYLYGGVMSPLPEINDARWPEDNISRRIKVATYDNTLQGWVFKETPVFGKVDHRSWPGHSYGQQIIKNGMTYYMFHEEVSREGVTEIFLRRMQTAFVAGPSKKLLGIESLGLDKTVRVDGGHLLEGPRYALIQGIHFIFFSTGDFPTKNYATRVAYSTVSIEGPYQVVSDATGAIDLTAAAKKFGLYGVGRAFPFKYQGNDWILFHGAKDVPGMNHNVWPANLDRFQRCLFAAPLDVKRVAGKVQISLR